MSQHLFPAVVSAFTSVFTELVGTDREECSNPLIRGGWGRETEKTGPLGELPAHDPGHDPF